MPACPNGQFPQIPARSKDVNGDEIGTFNDDTRPRSAHAITLIGDAVSDIQSHVRNAAGGARGRGRSAVEGYRTLLHSKITALQDAVRGLEPGGSLVSSTRIEVPSVDYLPEPPSPSGSSSELRRSD
jgi:hypothetical protein